MEISSSDEVTSSLAAHHWSLLTSNIVPQYPLFVRTTLDQKYCKGMEVVVIVIDWQTQMRFPKSPVWKSSLFPPTKPLPLCHLGHLKASSPAEKIT